MLTGRRAFDGEDVSLTLSRVLQTEPDFDLLPAATPAAVRQLIRRCLVKDPKQRLRDIGEARLTLSGLPDATSTATGAGDVSRRRDPSGWMRAAALGLIGAATGIAVGATLWRGGASEPPSETRLDIATPPTNSPVAFSLSPDGRRITFVARSEGVDALWVRDLHTTDARVIFGTESVASIPFWSPDSQSVAFVSGGKLRRIDLATGSTLTLADVQAGAIGGAWSPSNTILYTPVSSGPLHRVSASGGESIPATKQAPGMSSHRHPQFLPDGRQFLFYSGGTPDVQGIYLGSLDHGDIRRLTPATGAARFMPPHWLLLVRNGTLVARRFDTSGGTLSEDALVVAEGFPYRGAGAEALSTSSTSLIAYRRGGEQRQLIWFDRTGRELGTYGDADEQMFAPALSPDEARVAVNRVTPDGSMSLWVVDPQRAVKFTPGRQAETFPVWAPDGARIALTSQGAAYIRNLDGSGQTKLSLTGPAGLTGATGLTDWSRDGRFILFDANSPTNDVWVLPLQPGEADGAARPAANVEPFPFANSPHAERLGHFSPDGRWVAYQSNETGRAEIYLRPFPGPGGQFQVSSGGGAQPEWRHDGKELYYIAPDATLMAVSTDLRGRAPILGAPAVLFRTRILMGGAEQPNRGQYVVARDGRFLITTLLPDAIVPPIVVVQNWAPR
jgi:Tol biopolymer transport system component